MSRHIRLALKSPRGHHTSPSSACLRLSSIITHHNCAFDSLRLCVDVPAAEPALTGHALKLPPRSLLPTPAETHALPRIMSMSMSMPATTAPQSTCWTLESELGVTLRVSLSSTVNSDECTNEPKPDAVGHHFILTGAATSANHPRVELSHDHLSAIARAMLEQIKSLRHGWLDIADSSTSTCKTFDQAALRLRLVPSTTLELNSYCQQTLVRLDWSDSRPDPPWPLSLLLQQTPLSTHLRDVVHRATSRILVEALLTSSSSASLFHRWWRQRRVQVDPLITTIAKSLSVLTDKSADPAKLAPVLTRLQTSCSSPTTVRLQTLLTRLDNAVFPAHESPSAWKRTSHQRLPPSTPELDIADLPYSDDEAHWLPVESQPSTLAPHLSIADPHSDLGLDIVVLPDEPDILEF